jgi:deazaflavin-dependent oxidoreductase (nitroreductase family)
MADTDDFNTTIIKEFRANAGKVGGPFEGAPMVLLLTVGAKSGQSRINPVMYRSDGGRMYVFASKGGAPTNPDWYFNMVANPEMSIEVGSDSYDVTATEIKGAERDRIYADQAKEYPGFAEYEAKTDREIPVVILEPAK